MRSPYPTLRHIPHTVTRARQGLDDAWHAFLPEFVGNLVEMGLAAYVEPLAGVETGHQR